MSFPIRSITLPVIPQVATSKDFFRLNFNEWTGKALLSPSEAPYAKLPCLSEGNKPRWIMA